MGVADGRLLLRMKSGVRLPWLNPCMPGLPFLICLRAIILIGLELYQHPHIGASYPRWLRCVSFLLLVCLENPSRGLAWGVTRPRRGRERDERVFVRFLLSSCLSSFLPPVRRMMALELSSPQLFASFRYVASNERLSCPVLVVTPPVPSRQTFAICFFVASSESSSMR